MSKKIEPPKRWEIINLLLEKCEDKDREIELNITIWELCILFVSFLEVVTDDEVITFLENLNKEQFEYKSNKIKNQELFQRLFNILEDQNDIDEKVLTQLSILMINKKQELIRKTNELIRRESTEDQ